MRRLAVTALILVAAARTAATAAGALPLIAKSKATVKVKSCSLEEKTAVFYARMKKLRGTRRMKLKFSLLERPAASRRFRRLHVSDLSRWHKSAVGVRAYVYSQEVRGLQGGSTYRMRVRYRWYDKDDDLQRRARRTSRPCRMFVPLANLGVVPVSRWYARGGWHYRVRVRNNGRAAAGGIVVQLFVDQTANAARQTVSHLEPGESKRLTLDGPKCTKRYGFRVAPDGTVPESNESDNRAPAAC